MSGFPGSATYFVSLNLGFLICEKEIKLPLPNLTGSLQEGREVTEQSPCLLPATP